jgi:dTDP-glucose pyrophosphorylase
MNKIKFGVIPAAGEGRRMGYLSCILPKCLFPLYDKPIIHHVIENMKSIDIENIYVIVNYQTDKIREYFERVKNDIGVQIILLPQDTLLGIAHAIMLTRKHINEPFIVMLGDDCTLTQSLSNLIDTFFKSDAIVVEGIVREKDQNILRSTCCVRLNNNGQITQITEKPKEPFSNLRGCGIYVFKSEIFKYIEKTPVSRIRNEIEITDAINLVATEGKAYGEFINGFNININSYDDLLLASILMKKFRRTLPLKA